MPLTKAVFDQLHNVTQYTLSTKDAAFVVNVIDYGATITNILVRDAKDVVRDVVLGFDSLQGYQSPDNAYFGAVVGRVANRIGGASFQLNDQTYELAKNTKDGRNHLHGGRTGFDKRMWSLTAETDYSITLQYTSVDGEEGYPVGLTVTVTYTVTENKELKMEYVAHGPTMESRSTIVNLTNHTYFNLSGADSESACLVLDHRMVFSEPRARNITGVLDKDEDLVPNGKVIAINSKAGLPFDFYQEDSGQLHTIGSRIDSVNGYDHAFVFADQSCDQLRRDILKVWSPQTNICLTMSTSEPAFQLYTGEFLSESLTSKQSTQARVKLGRRSGFCLEANRYPDAINHQDWRQQVILQPGQVYRQTTVYQFTAFYRSCEISSGISEISAAE